MGLFRFKHRTITYSTAATAASFTPSKTAGSSEVSSMAFILIWGAEAQVVRKGGAYALGDIMIQVCLQGTPRWTAMGTLQPSLNWQQPKSHTVLSNDKLRRVLLYLNLMNTSKISKLENTKNRIL